MTIGHHAHAGHEPHVRPFADWLREQSQGKSHDELSDALRDLIARVKDTGKKGTLTYTITIEQMKGAEDNILLVGDNIALKLPEFPRKPSVFYTDADGNLTRRDPNQLEFESLREVPAPPSAGVPAGVDPITGEVTDTAILAATRGKNGA